MNDIIATPFATNKALSLGANVAAPNARARSEGAANAARLGTYTKSSPQINNPDTLKASKLVALRVDRYRLQNSARALFLAEYRMSHDGAQTIPFSDYNKLHRVVKCKRTKTDFQVGIHKSLDSGSCFYSGLSVCGSVWGCPVCCSKVQERRRVEISHCMDWAYSNSKTCVMVTLTIPHYYNQSCSELLEKQKQALVTFRKTGEWTRKMKAFGFIGVMRSLEVTHGKNGWHPHTHEIFVVDSFFDRVAFSNLIRKRWEIACKGQGLIKKGKLKPFREFSVNFRFDASNSDYLAKSDDEKNMSWGADRELAKGMTKASKGAHPFQLLDAFSQGHFSKGTLFLEYVKAFKGKSMIFISPKLRKLAGLKVHMTDLEVAQKEEDPAELLSSLDTHAWQVVLDNDFRAGILYLAEFEGLEGVGNWLKSKGVDLFTDSFRSFMTRLNEVQDNQDSYEPDVVIEPLVINCLR